MLITVDIPDSDWFYLSQSVERGLVCSVGGSVYYLSLEQTPNMEYAVTLRLPFSSFKTSPSHTPRSRQFLIPPSHTPSHTTSHTPSYTPSHTPSHTHSHTPSHTHSQSYQLTDNESALLKWAESRVDPLEVVDNAYLITHLNMTSHGVTRAKNSLLRKGLLLYEAYDDKRFVLIPKSHPESEKLHQTAKSISNSDLF